MHLSDITNCAVVIPPSCKKAKVESWLNTAQTGETGTGTNGQPIREITNLPTLKRPPLFPHFLHRTSYSTGGIGLEQVPPIHLGTRLEQVFLVLQWLRHDVPLSEVNQDLLLLLPERPAVTRQALLRFVEREATHHLSSYRSAHVANKSQHLEAFCIIQLWMDQFASIVNTLVKEQIHVPWFCIAHLQTENDESGDVKEKVNAIMSSSPDVLVCATLLVSAGQLHEAVDFLIDHNHIDEALILARLRLDPEAAWSIVERCMKLKPKESGMGDVFYAHEIHKLASMGQIRLHSIENCGSLLYQSGSRVNQLACCWLQLGIHTGSDVADLPTQLNDVLQLAFLCLLVGFQFDGEDWRSRQQRFFEQWKLALDKPSTLWSIPSLGRTCFQSLMNTALMLSSALDNCEHIDPNTRPRLGNRTNRFVHALDQMVSNRELTSHWPTCLTYLAVDLTSCLALCRGPSVTDDDYNENNEDNDDNNKENNNNENNNNVTNNNVTNNNENNNIENNNNENNNIENNNIENNNNNENNNVTNNNSENNNNKENNNNVNNNNKNNNIENNNIENNNNVNNNNENNNIENNNVTNNNSENNNNKENKNKNSSNTNNNETNNTDGLADAASKDDETRFTRVRRSLRVCWVVNPKKTDLLISHLQVAAGLLSPDDWRLFYKLSELLPRMHAIESLPE